MRSKSKPTNPRTFFQAGQRAIFGAISQAWRSLSQAQRNAWDAAAPDFKYQNRLGDSKTLSGFAIHQQLNANLLLIGQGAISSPPIPQEMSSPVSAAGNVSAAADEITVRATFVGQEEASTTVAIYASPHLSQGVKNASNRYRFLTAVPASALTTPTGKDITSEYTYRFGMPPVGSKVAFRLVSISAVSGEASAPLDFATVVMT